jgi:hypothetical protein
MQSKKKTTSENVNFWQQKQTSTALSCHLVLNGKKSLNTKK